MLLTRPPRKQVSFRLACVKPAASVRSEPGSNSPIVFVKFELIWLLRDLLLAYQ